MTVGLIVSPHHRKWPQRNGEQQAAPAGNSDSLRLGMSAIPSYLAGKTSQKEDNGKRRREQNDQDDEGEYLKGHAVTNEK